MKKKVAIIGSRKLACKLTKWMSTSPDIEIVGGIYPPFDGWWNDELKSTFEDLDIPAYESLELLLEKSPDIIFSINYWKLIDENLKCS